MLSFVISDTGANPLVAYNGQECVDIVKKQHVDMILMDYNMPIMNGIEATKLIRSLPQGEKIVIIGITVYDDDNDAKSSIEAGMNMLAPKLDLTDEKLIEIGQKYFSEESYDAPVSQAENFSSSQCEKTDEPLSDPDENVIMDYERVLREFDNEEEILIPLMIEFEKIIQDKLSFMQDALKKDDFGFVQKEAHGIRGGAANLCADPLTNAARLLERACRQGSEASIIADHFDTLVEKIQEFSFYVKNKVNMGENTQLS